MIQASRIKERSSIACMEFDIHFALEGSTPDLHLDIITPEEHHRSPKNILCLGGHAGTIRLLIDAAEHLQSGDGSASFQRFQAQRNCAKQPWELVAQLRYSRAKD